MWPFERASGRAARASRERVSVAVQGPLRANNSEVLRDAVLAGLGIALLPDFSAAAALRAGRLREVLPQWRPVGFFGDAIYAIRPWSPTTPRAVQVLVEHLRARRSPAAWDLTLRRLVLPQHRRQLVLALQAVQPVVDGREQQPAPAGTAARR